jgi:GTPase SAR1 family protein
LVGTKQDLRDDKEILERLNGMNLSPITFKDGNKLKRDIGAIKYMECSALNGEGIQAIFDEAVKAALLPTISKRKNFCVIL